MPAPFLWAWPLSGLFLAAWVLTAAAGSVQAVKTRPGFEPVRIDLAAWQAAFPKPAAKGTTRVLLIGNSFTFEHDLPAMLRGLAASAGFSLETAMVAVGGARLAEHAGNRDLLDVLSTIAWTDVVLQDFSTAALSEAHRQRSHAAVAHLAQPAQEGGGRVHLFATWPRQAGHILYGTGGPATPDDMNAQVAEYYRSLAAAARAGVAPVGTVWRAVERQHPDIALYRSDRYHASPAGTYLAALVILSRLAPVAFRTADFTPALLDPGTARRLRVAVRGALAK
ncbi:MAG: hypothetical protein AAF713_01090 [Pseudomonadota bacterium]